MDKLEKIRMLLKECGWDGIIVSGRNNYSWVTNGLKNHVIENTPLGVASLFITPDTLSLVADSSDLLRMMEEQDNLFAEPVEIPWYQPAEEYWAKLCGGKRMASDSGIVNTEDAEPMLQGLRLNLDEQELEVYHTAGEKIAKAVEQACFEAKQGDTEQHIATRAKYFAMEQGVDPACVLVGSDQRLLKYRHPMPTSKRIEKSLMVVMGGEFKGLWASVTRMVHWGDAPKEMEENFSKLQYLFAKMQLAMDGGLAYTAYFKYVQDLYAQAGYPKEWKLHHQGGPTGYACREYVVRPDTMGSMQYNQAFAWNPTLQGTKCEETTILTPNGIKAVTITGNWPTRTIQLEEGSFVAADILKK